MICLILLGSRLHDFNIGLTDDHPLSVAPSPDNYQLCAQYNGTVDTGATIYMSCDHRCTMGRYLIVQIPGDMETLTLCEVEVYAG